MSRPATAASGMNGILLILVAMACFAGLDTTTKYVTASVPLVMALWVRYAFQAVSTTLLVLPTRGLSVFKTAHPKFQLLRGLLILTSSLLAFISLRYLPVGEFTAIVMITPLAITLLALTSLGEKVSPLRWLLVAGGFAGSLIIMRPGGDAFTWASVLPLGLVACNAAFQVLTSKMARTEDPVTMHLYTGWVGTLAVSFALPFVWTSAISWQLWTLLMLMGVFATVGHFLMILAYQGAPAASLTPYLYAQIGFAMIGGWLVFSHVPDGWSTIGMVMIAICGAGGAWLTVHEGRASRQIAIQPVEA
ncbi:MULTISPECIES: DMT family transporter [Polaromonas]|uniref:DMT family transporter n=1 Tax=Polaromonas aquatica TaxID=332657 RepID=A0ABW1U7K3_9BURK